MKTMRWRFMTPWGGRLWRKYLSRSSSSKLSNFSALCLFNGLRPWVAFRALRWNDRPHLKWAAAVAFTDAQLTGLNLNSWMSAPFNCCWFKHALRSKYQEPFQVPTQLHVSFSNYWNHFWMKYLKTLCHCSIHVFYCVHLKKNTCRRCVKLSEVNESSAAG